MTRDDLLETGRRVLVSQPFSVALGTELLSLSEGAAEVRVPITTETLQQHGVVQGGFCATSRTTPSPSPVEACSDLTWSPPS